MELHRAKPYRTEWLRPGILRLASDAMATLRHLAPPLRGLAGYREGQLLATGHKELPRLSHVSVHDTGVSEAGVDELRQGLPALVVDHRQCAHAAGPRRPCRTARRRDVNLSNRLHRLGRCTS